MVLVLTFCDLDITGVSKHPVALTRADFGHAAQRAWSSAELVVYVYVRSEVAYVLKSANGTRGVIPTTELVNRIWLERS